MLVQKALHADIQRLLWVRILSACARGEQHEHEAQAIDSQQELGAHGRNPVGFLEKLEIGEGGIEAAHHQEGGERRGPADGMARGAGVGLRQHADHERAEQLYVRALETRRTRLPADHPRVTETVDALVDLYEQWGKPERAAAMRASGF